jgi:hypothetical protein
MERVMEKLTCRSFGKLFTFALTLAAMPACGGAGNQNVTGEGAVVNRATQALSSISNFLEFNGSYGSGCHEFTGNWSLPLAQLINQTNQTLAVVKNDTDCQLTLTSLLVGDDESSAVMYQTQSGITLTGEYADNPSPFAVNQGDAVVFYANGRIEPDASFSTDFTMRVLYSDDSTAASSSANAVYATQSASAATSDVPAPNYTATTNVAIEVDANNIVQSDTGTVDLSLPGMSPQTGEYYVVTTTALSSSPAYSDVDAAYNAGTPASLSMSSPSIPASALGLASVNLSTPAIRRIIIAHFDNGTPSYEVITVTFNHP